MPDSPCIDTAWGDIWHVWNYPAEWGEGVSIGAPIEEGVILDNWPFDFEGDPRDFDGNPNVNVKLDRDMGWDEFVSGPVAISALPEPLVISAAGGEATIKVKNANPGLMQWSAALAAPSDWLAITQGTELNYGINLIVSADKNLIASPREAQIIITAPGASNSPLTVLARQEAYVPPMLAVSPGTAPVSFLGGTAQVEVDNAGGDVMPWTATVIAGNSFASIIGPASGQDHGVVAVKFSENADHGPRTASVRVVAPDAANSPITVELTQDAKPKPRLGVAPMLINFSHEASQGQVQITNKSIGAMTYEAAVIEGGGWLSLANDAGDAPAVLTVMAARNENYVERTGRVMVTGAAADDSPKFVQVFQQRNPAPVLQVTPTSQDVSYHGGSATFLVLNLAATPMHWTAAVIDGGAWCHITQGASGAESGFVQAAFSENTSGTSRTARIRVLAPGATDGDQEVSLVQGVNDVVRLEVNPVFQSVPAQSGVATFEVGQQQSKALGYAASIVSGQQWLHIISGATGENMGTIMVQYGQNASSQGRTGSLEVTSPEAVNSPLRVEISQAGYECSKPSPPRNVQAAWTSDGKVSLVWDAPETAGPDLEYKVFRGTAPTFAMAQPLTSEWSAGNSEEDPAPYAVTSALSCAKETGPELWYWVVARNTCDTSEPSEPAMLEAEGTTQTGAGMMNSALTVGIAIMLLIGAGRRRKKHAPCG